MEGVRETGAGAVEGMGDTDIGVVEADMVEVEARSGSGRGLVRIDALSRGAEERGVDGGVEARIVQPYQRAGMLAAMVERGDAGSRLSLSLSLFQPYAPFSKTQSRSVCTRSV